MAGKQHVKAENVVEEQKPDPEIEVEVITADQVILLEKLKDMRILLPNGNFIRLEERQNGIYWSVPVG